MTVPLTIAILILGYFLPKVFLLVSIVSLLYVGIDVAFAWFVLYLLLR